MQWTESKTEQLKELWEQGSIATEIAKELGTSRCSVLGKANRLNLVARKQGALRGVKRSIVPVTPVVIEGPANPTLLEDLKDIHCRFPLWKENTDPHLFCGRQRWNHTSYCKAHFSQIHVKDLRPI